MQSERQQRKRDRDRERQREAERTNPISTVQTQTERCREGGYGETGTNS
jgi:hypothetical protein